MEEVQTKDGEKMGMCQRLINVEDGDVGGELRQSWGWHQRGNDSGGFLFSVNMDNSVRPTQLPEFLLPVLRHVSSIGRSSGAVDVDARIQ